MLQAKIFDLIEAVTEAKVVIHHLNTKRNDDTAWNELFDKATALAANVNEVPSIPRGDARQQLRNNVPAATPERERCSSLSWTICCRNCKIALWETKTGFLLSN